MPEAARLRDTSHADPKREEQGPAQQPDAPAGQDKKAAGPSEFHVGEGHGDKDSLGRKEELLRPFFQDMCDVAGQLQPQFAAMGMHFRPEVLLATAMQEAADRDPVNNRSFDNGLGIMQITPYRGQLDPPIAKAIGWDNSKGIEYNVAHSNWKSARANILAGGIELLGKAKSIKVLVPKIWDQMDERHRCRATMYAYNAGEGSASRALEHGGPNAPMISTFKDPQGRVISHDYTAELDHKLNYVDGHDPFGGAPGGTSPSQQQAEKQAQQAPSGGQKAPQNGPEKGKGDSRLRGSVGRGGVNAPEDVRAVQGRLKERGVDPGPIDGICGPHTIAAIVIFQESIHGVGDGRIDVGLTTEVALFTTDGKVTPAVNDKTKQAATEAQGGGQHQAQHGAAPTHTAPATGHGGQTKRPVLPGIDPAHPLRNSVGRGGANQPDDVLLVQQRLTARGLDPGPVDGACGPRTLAAILEFQQAMKFGHDGRIDRDGPTEKLLFSSTERVAPPKENKPQGQHGQAPAPQQQQGAGEHQHDVTKPVPSNGLERIEPGVKLTAPITAAWKVLMPYLPRSAMMTSGLRTDQDQANIINRFYAENGGPASIKDVERRREWLGHKGFIIARVGSSPHRTGLAFDISGAPLGEIQAAIIRCHDDKRGEFHFLDTIIERANNCIHVNLSG